MLNVNSTVLNFKAQTNEHHYDLYSYVLLQCVHEKGSDQLIVTLYMYLSIPLYTIS